MQTAIFDSLNEAQVQAVKSTEGKVRVVAGAGSGKTRVLTHRYVYLTEHLGIDPSHILCMTFTNKAAQEMRTRIGKMTARHAVGDYICTIHGLCVKILRKEIYRLGYPRSFRIDDVDDCKELMKQVMEEQHINRTVMTVSQLLEHVATEKASGTYVEQLLPDTPFPDNTLTSPFLRFLQLQRQYFALDFDDLILFTLYLFAHFPEALDFWQKEFDYIQIDEVQDCSQNDWRLIDYLTGQCDNLFIVGDPDQSIYEWRGARPETFVHFKADTDIILDENYRSTPNILNVANAVIKNNVNRVAKDLHTHIPADTLVVYKHAWDETEEGRWIVTQINQLIQKGSRPSDFAILYRTSSLSRFVEEALMNKRLPYTIWGGVRFFERKEVKDCLAYLRLLVEADNRSFRRVINVPSRRFGKAKAEALEALAKEEGRSLYDTLAIHIHEKPFANTALLPTFMETIATLRNKVDKIPLADLLEEVLRATGLGDLYRLDSDEERLENINELINSIRYYEQTHAHDTVTLMQYLQDIALFTNCDYSKDTDTIKLMTIHQAKGLEFPYVFVVGLTEGIFPSHRTIRERLQNGLEEERRLMYVAITRAERALFLTESDGFMSNMQMGKYPSRFLAEIGDGLLKVDGTVDPELFHRSQALVEILNQELGMESHEAEWTMGDKVRHEVFGTGVIVAVNPIRNCCEVMFSDKRRNVQNKFLEKA